MGEKTGIAWTDHTFNPWLGCTKVSSGCKNCYSETIATNRMGLRWGPDGDRRKTKYWDKPLKWDRAARKAGERRRVFCASMADVFEDHPGVEEYRKELWYLIEDCPNLDWLLLTKRPENISAMLPRQLQGESCGGCSNVWLGATVESAAYVPRIEKLRQVPAARRFISYEPALGSLGDVDLAGIDLLIYGGESGPNFRPDDDQWARDVKELCRQQDVAFFYKQCSGVRPPKPGLLDGERIEEWPISPMKSV